MNKITLRSWPFARRMTSSEAPILKSLKYYSNVAIFWNQIQDLRYSIVPWKSSINSCDGSFMAEQSCLTDGPLCRSPLLSFSRHFDGWPMGPLAERSLNDRSRCACASQLEIIKDFLRRRATACLDKAHYPRRRGYICRCVRVCYDSRSSSSAQLNLSLERAICCYTR